MIVCPIAHVSHPPRCPISIFNITHDIPLPMCPIAHVSCCTYQKRCQVVRKMSSCQKDVKLSKRCHMSKSQTHRLWRRFTKKKKIHIMRFTHIDVNFDVKYEGNQNCSKTLSMHILRGFGHHHM